MNPATPQNNLFLKSIFVFSFFIFSFSFIHAQTIMYGMTSAGGSHSDGTIYKFDPSTNTETVVYSFAGGTADGASPQYGNLTFDGNNNLFYGMTQSGGANGDGTIFSFNINTNAETLLYSFKGGNTDGASPQDNLTYDPVNGLFYGMTQLGGSSNNAGTIFSFNPSTNTETQLFAFGVNPVIGTPYEGMVYNSTNGLFYGGCWYGGTHNFGGIFSFNPTNNTETTLYNLGATNDGRYAGLQFTMDPVNGKYYLSGWEGCAHGGGGIMSFDPTTNTEAVVYSLQGGTDGRACTGPLAYYSSTGVFYGVTQGATTQVNGTLYKFDPATNTHTVIHDFAGSPNDAAEPQTGVVYNYSNGLYYGTTEIGGTYNKGTIYSFNPITNAVTVVWSFGGTGDGQTPMGSAVQANPNCFLTASGSVLSNVACGGGNTGSATVSASAGQTPYTYLWSGNNSQTTATATGLSAGTYTVFVHDLAGCEAVSYITITQPNPFSINIASHTNASCAGPGTATAALTSYTYTTNYSYEPAVQHFTVPAGVTSITITAAGGQGGGNGSNSDIGGDGASLTGICTVIPGHVISIVVGQKGGYSPGDFGSGGGGASFVYDSNTNSLLVVAAGGGGAGWQSNGGAAGTNILTNATTTGAGLDGDAAGGTGGTGGSGGGNNVSPGPGPGGAGWISNGGNSVDDANGDAPYYNGNGGQDRANHFAGGTESTGDFNYGGYGGGGSGGYDAGGGGGGYNGGGGGKDDNAAFNGNGGGGGGSYLSGTLSGTVTATDTGNGFVSIQYPGPGGVAPYTYSWTPSGGTNLTASGLSGGSYTITATDANGCSATESTIITQSAPLTINATVLANVSCNGGNNGSAVANVGGGSSPYSYVWSDAGTTTTTTANINNLSQGVYTVTVTDANNCNATASVSISQPVQFLYVSAGSLSSVTCHGLSNGVATVNSVGGNTPYTYSWSNGSTTVSNVQTPNTLTAGTYTVTVTDNCGVSKTSSVTIVQPNVMRDSVKTQTNISCNGGNGGCITLGCKGGTLPYLYLWSSGSTVVTASSLSAGTYSVVITDQKGCSNTVSNITLTQPGILHDSVANISYPICNGGTGTVSIGVRGGTLPYTYIWSPNLSTTATANNLTARSYTVTVKDAHNCTPAVVTFSVTQPNAIRDTIVKSLTVNASCNGSGASATVGVKYGTPPYTYNWTGNVSSTATATGLGIGTYTVSITDINGCSGSVASVTISQVSALRDSIVKTATINVSCNGGNNGSATVGIRAGTPPYTYTWNPNVSSTATAAGLSMGIYTITVMDNAGCSGSAITVSISQPDVLRDSAASLTHVGCYGGNGGTASIGTRGGTAPYTYLWSNGKTTYNVTGLTFGVYTVSVTDNNGCSNTIGSITITQPAAALTSTIPTPTCLGGGNGTITISAGGGTAPYHYAWSNGNTSSSMTVASNTYHITVSDAHGCNSTNSVVLACPEALHREEMESPAPPCCATIDNVNLYPNPNKGQFNLTGLQPDMTVEMYDYTGRKISTQLSTFNSQLLIDISSEPNGIYLIRVLDKDGNIVGQKKVVKTN
ncbi:MAG TPA: choice-of-anchor tandem repeat GloVer-containing protein [Bacteroidia bacterium]|jgi:uncharacterized repeat protein (TIGR03803 family)|nr:choice-of-anchor tandem repeat GloVer-containing protein [Bacteroidia bacterium]